MKFTMKFRPPMVVWIALLACLAPLPLIVVLILVRSFVEARYIPSSAMEPSLQINDRILVDKTWRFTHAPFTRGEIILFYPPPIEMGGKDLIGDLPHTLGRLTGLPIFPFEPAYIKRIVGLPGDKIAIKHRIGVHVNGKLLSEKYVAEYPDYDLNVLGDIGGRDVSGDIIKPYSEQATKPIVVPPNEFFVLGDNRNNSEDSHVWGFVDQDRIIGIATMKLDGTKIEVPQYDQ